MKLLQIIKLIIPPIISKLIHWVKRKAIPLEPSPLPQIEHHSKKMILIGNGPSLLKTVNSYYNEIIKSDRMATNFFAATDCYERLKPNIYLMADPAFFDEEVCCRNSIGSLFQSILKKTTWPMRIIVPFDVRDSRVIEVLKKNRLIRMDYYSCVNQNINGLSKFEGWDKNYICPPSQNVMNVALYLSLFWGYEETYLIGADMSSLEDIRIDQETNELFSIDRHFYNNKDVYFDRDLFDERRGRIRSDWNLHDYIYAFGRMFEHFYDLKRYADYKGLKVYNASEYSWINVFERRKLQ